MAKNPAKTKKAAKKDAAKKKGGAKGAAAQAASDTGERREPMKSKAQQIGVNDFLNLVRRCKSLAKQTQETAGEKGDLIRKAADNKNLDRVAFAMFMRLERMSEQKRVTTLACFDYYRDIGKLDEQEQGDLGIKRAEAGEKDDETDPPPPAKAEGERDLRPPHLRTVAEGGTRVDEESLKTVGRGQPSAA